MSRVPSVGSRLEPPVSARSVPGTAGLNTFLLGKQNSTVQSEETGFGRRREGLGGGNRDWEEERGFGRRREGLGGG